MLLSEIVNLTEMARQGSKLDACEQIYNQYKDTLSRKEMIDLFVKQAGCTPLGASTFYSNIKKSAGLSASPSLIAPKSPLQTPKRAPAPPSVQELTPTQKIENWLVKHGVKNYSINNGVVDVDGSVDLENIADRKLSVQFGTVTGNFYIGANRLTTLEGCPSVVGGNFNCAYNDLKSLLHGPSQVGKSYFCQYNDLTSLEGAPKTLPGDFYCSGNINLTNLKGAPETVNGDFMALDVGVTSLHEIHKTIKYVGDTLKVLNASNVAITQILGIVLIDGIQSLSFGADDASIAVRDIIRKYMYDDVTNQPIPKNKRDIITCQDELIDAGYAKFAKL